MSIEEYITGRIKVLEKENEELKIKNSRLDSDLKQAQISNGEMSMFIRDVLQESNLESEDNFTLTFKIKECSITIEKSGCIKYIKSFIDNPEGGGV